jgi:phosphate transport system substrate-binding protein
MGTLNRWWLTLISSATLMVSVTACGNNPSTEVDIDFPSALTQTEGGRVVLEPALAGTITIDGSSTVFPITTVMAREFQKTHPGVHISISVSGNGGWIQEVLRG